MGNHRENIEKMAARIKELDSEIRKLEAIADKALAEVKAEYQRQIKDLFLKKEAVQNKILKVQKVSGKVWEDMKAGTELSWEVLEDSIKKPRQKKQAEK